MGIEPPQRSFNSKERTSPKEQCDDIAEVNLKFLSEKLIDIFIALYCDNINKCIIEAFKVKMVMMTAVLIHR